MLLVQIFDVAKIGNKSESCKLFAEKVPKYYGLPKLFVYLQAVTQIFIQMSASTIGGIIGVALFILGYILYGIYKSGKRMYNLQQLASNYGAEFKVFINESPGWRVDDLPENKSKWYKLYDSNNIPYYIQYYGPGSFEKSVEILMSNFINYKI